MTMMTTVSCCYFFDVQTANDTEISFFEFAISLFYNNYIVFRLSCISEVDDEAAAEESDSDNEAVDEE